MLVDAAATANLIAHAAALAALAAAAPDLAALPPLPRCALPPSLPSALASRALAAADVDVDLEITLKAEPAKENVKRIK